MLKTKPVKKESTLKPLTNKEANMTRKALITKVNRPRDKILTGKVKNSKTGLIKAFKIPKTTAVTKAAIKLSTTTPGISQAAIKTLKLLTKRLIIIFMILF